MYIFFFRDNFSSGLIYLIKEIGGLHLLFLKNPDVNIYKYSHPVSVKVLKRRALIISG